MFDTSIRRHPVQTFQFWFVVLTCFVTVTAWKLDLFSFSFPQAPLTVLTEEPMPPPPSLGAVEELAALGSAAPRQSEEMNSESMPALQEVTRQLVDVDETASVESTANQSVAGGPTGDAPVVRTAGIEQLGHSDAAVVQASAQQESQLPIVAKATVPEIPVSKVSPRVAINFAEVDRLMAAGQDVAAHRLLSEWYWKYPESRSQLWERINMLASRIYFMPDIHYLDPYQVQFGERLENVAAGYHVTSEYLVKLNRLHTPSIRAGQALKVIQGPFSAVVDVSDLEMTIHAQGYFVARFKVGFGTDQSIPHGTFRVTDKVLDPDYSGPQGIISHTNAANPLGSRWLTINDEHHSLQGYGLHGATAPELIGKIEGAGCLRLQPREIEAVYDLLTVGSELIIHP